MILTTLQTALMEFAANKLRTGLTMLGIVIGVAAVIALMAAGQGAKTGVTKEVSGLGSNLIFVKPAAQQQQGSNVRMVSNSITQDDATAIAESPLLPDVEAVISQFVLPIDSNLIGNGRNTTASFTATEPGFPVVRSYDVAAGRFFNQDDVDRKATNVVLGAKVAKDLFDTSASAIGQQVRISLGPMSVTMTVVGVMEERGAAGSGEDDSQVYMPLTTFSSKISFGRNPTGRTTISEIVVKVSSGNKVESTKEAIRQVMLEQHDYSEDFAVETQEDLMASAKQVSRTLTILLGAIAGISLVVGGIGTMNIMLVSVTERTREIGIRKALGASSGNILTQFVFEAVIVTIAGGLLGVAIGAGAALLANGRSFGMESAVTTSVTPVSVVVAFTVSVLIGLFFGIYPAFRASRLDPIEALRAE